MPRCFAPIGTEAAPMPIVERIYEPGPGEKPPKEKKDVRRVFAVIFVLIVVVIIVIAIAFNYLIPRIEVKLISDYRESSGLSINVDFKVKNEGTLGIQHYSMNVTVFNSSGGVVAEKDYYVSDVDPHTTEPWFPVVHPTVAITIHPLAAVNRTTFFERAVAEVQFADRLPRFNVDDVS